MEQVYLQEILNALKLHSEHIDKKVDGMREDLENRMDEGFQLVDKRFKQVDRRFDNLGKKVDGIRVDLSETRPGKGCANVGRKGRF